MEARRLKCSLTGRLPESRVQFRSSSCAALQLCRCPMYARTRASISVHTSMLASGMTAIRQSGEVFGGDHRGGVILD
jgi:hypothetical protein